MLSRVDLALKDDVPESATTSDINAIKAEFHPSNTANVNMISYHIYDTDEHVVGEWRETINGVKKKKPIYEKSIIGEATTTNNTYVSIGATDSLIPDLETLVDHSISITGNGVATQYHTFCNLRISDDNKIQVIQNFSSSSNTFAYYIVVEYTKTTDEWQPV